MHPDLFSIGPLTLHTYGLFVALGFIAGIFVATRLGKTVGFMSNAVMDMGFIIILTGLIGSRIVYIIIEFQHYVANPLDIIKLWQGGLVFSGGLVAVIIAMIFYAKYYKVNIWTISDIWAPAAAIGQAIGRIGCFFAGCCYGKPTDVPWAVIFTNPKSIATLNIPIHPTQIYSSLGSFIIFIILIILHSKKKFEGQVFLWFLIFHSTARLFLERFRGDPRGIIMTDNLTMTQFIAIIILIGAVTALFIFKPKDKK
ncbi:MAG: prolipoprotein diacylglyceryl transferase [Desulfobacteraceae bacterium]|jgi:phosphatidylglycerol:prolipoprotein diacylglycerol transferase